MSTATVPFPGHQPIDEMDEALAMLRTLRTALTADAQKLGSISSMDAEVMVADALNHLDPIRTFIAENMPDGKTISFLECRRHWYAQKGGEQ